MRLNSNAEVMRKLELVWGICGLLGIFYPCSVSYYSYLSVQYAYLLYSGCYFGVWFGMILKRKFSAGQLCGIVSWGWVDFLVTSLMLFLSVRACVDFKDNGFVLLQIAVSALGYYCFRNIPRKHFVWYIIALLIGGGIQIAYAFCTQADYFLLSEKGSRIYGSFLNTSVWGNYLALLLLMSLGVMAWGKRWCRLLLLIPCGLLLFNRGTSLYAARRLDEAKDALKCSFLYTPDYNTAMLLGEIYSELQKCDSATYYWHLASEMVPNRIMPHFYLFRLYRGCDIKKAYKEAELIKNMPVKVYASQLNDIYREIDDFIGHVPKEYSGR